MSTDIFPMPTHLKDILIPTGNKNSELHVEGAVKCSCGCENFHITIYADTEKGYPVVCGYNDSYALIVKAVCMDCRRKHLIFDSNKHGWNGFVCHEDVEVPDEKLVRWNCTKCGCDTHGIKLGINSHGKQDFIDESGIADGDSDFSEDDWVNAFDWITIDINCFKCMRHDKKWIDFETM